MNRHLVVAALGMCGALSLQAAKERPDLYVQDNTRPRMSLRSECIETLKI